MNKAKTKFNLIVIVLLTTICLLLGSIISAFISPNRAFALTDGGIGNAVKVGNGVELWNGDTNIFNGVVLNDLKQKLFNNQNPKDYIESNYNRDEYTLTGSKIVTAKTLNTQVGKPNEGMIVRLGGQDWMVTSLTTTNDGKEDIVLTLYLANPDPNEKVQFWSSANNSKGENMYASSILREHLLQSSKWSMFSKGYFASNFLVQPTKIQYQHTQSAYYRLDNGHQYHSPNDALDTLINGEGIGIWHSNFKDPYKAEDIFNDNSGNPQRYDAWGDDYIWISSLVETGNTTDYVREHSIWKLSNTQLQFWNGISTDATNRVWTRSGRALNYYHQQTISAAGAPNHDNSVTSSFGVRPAIHLNLSSAINANPNKLDNPIDLTSTYNEKVQTVSEIATATKASWYDKNIYENVDSYINVTYPNDMTGVKNAGEHWVKFEITQAYINAVNAEVEKEGADNGWTRDKIEQVKELRKPKFLGEVDKEDTAHSESDTVRWIKITINQAEIDFSNVKWSADTLEYNATLQDVTIKSGLPSFLNPQYSDNSKLEVNADGTFYTAKVVEFKGEDNNYKIPTTAEIESIPQLQHKWQITKKQIVVSWSSENVTIGDLTLIIPKLNIAENLVNSIEYKYYRNSNFTDEVTLDEIFAENDISQKKSYWVTATLKNSGGDFNSTNCIFLVDGTPTDCADKRFETGDKINKVEVGLADNKLIYNGVEQQVKFNVTGGGLTADALMVTYKTANGSIMNGLPINVGRYRVAVALKDGYDKFIIVGDSEFEFEITSLKVNKPKENQIQFFDIDGYDLSQVANMPSDWDKYFEIRVFDKDNNEILPQNGNWKFVNANKYKIEIHFKNGVNTGNGGSTDNVIWEDDTKDTFVVTLEIMPLEFVFVGWEDATSNKRPTLIADEIGEIEKYFNYVIYEIKNNIIIGNELPQNAVLKYNTNYQINLRVKAEFKGNVYLIYNDDKIDETPVHKFKTDINPNPGGGDGSGEGDGSGDGDGSGGNNDSNTNSGTDLWFGENGKMPIFAWILVGSNLLTLLLIVILVIALLRKNKDREKFARVQPTESVNNKRNVQANNGDKNAYVNGSLMTDKDWTFIVREKDVLNKKALENQTERVLMYACRESEVKKLKKFQNELAEGNQQPETDTQDSKKKKKKR